MKECCNCNTEMIDDCIIEGQHPFEIGVDGRTDISLHIPTNEQGEFLGIKYDKVKKIPIRAMACPKCGKIELYARLNEQTFI